MRGILSKLDQTIGISSDAEITLEMDPGTFDAARICRLTGMGFNRISVGIQSFSDLILTKAGRAHTSFDSYAALGILSEQACLRSYSVDLIAALPYLSPELWTETLDIVLGYKPPHISVYDLQIEERSAFGRWYSPYTSPLPTEQDSVGMYTTAVSKLVSEGGYEHYELSNYAISADHRSKHNQQYWQCKDTLGFGLGAASYIGGKRYTRPNRMQTYEEFVTSAEQNGDVYWNILGRYASAGGCDLVEPVAPDLEEFLMLSLRTADGLDMDKLQRNYGAEVRSKVESALAGYIEESSTRQSSVIQKVVTPNGECALRLADPQGFLLSNHIISDVFAKLR
ncbi:coproporphyrinogen III oxidase [archaeon]|nr:MAG: coproporphyrinogen III oxidase [archaeon]